MAAIGNWTSGEGRPLFLVHGTPGAQERFALCWLSWSPTQVCVRDGQGRGGDTYQLEREFEDVATVVDAIAEALASRSDVDVYGGSCVFGAAALTSNIRRLVLYEGNPW